jgi:hypothetical protein
MGIKKLLIEIEIKTFFQQGTMVNLRRGERIFYSFLCNSSLS